MRSSCAENFSEISSAIFLGIHLIIIFETGNFCKAFTGYRNELLQKDLSETNELVEGFLESLAIIGGNNQKMLGVPDIVA